MAFSRRTAVARQPNRLSTAKDEREARGDRWIDLTVSNPTTAGLPYPEAEILGALADPRALTYAPAPLGLASTRDAIAKSYDDAGIVVDPSCIVPVASTSEAYSYLFKLLCDDGDDVLVPAPSYPLVDLLARFEGVKLAMYPLAYDGEWHIDHEAVRSAVTARTRAILTVSPNNPTGSYVKERELERLASLGLPIVSDEVFAPFDLRPALAGNPRAKSVLASPHADLVFALSGLSKMAALPQMKLGWIVVGGTSAARRGEALGRLELLADAFLSAGTPVQVAAPRLLGTRGVTQRAIKDRLRHNLATLRRVADGTAVSVLDVEGGWYAVVRLPRVETEEAWALTFLEQDGVHVHPGHFFDFAEEAYVVVSLLTPPELLAEGARRIVARVTTVVSGS
jgi:aspartate/methionine/tyrosine aminotransferase